MNNKKFAPDEIARILHRVRADRMNPPMGGRAEEDRRTKSDLAAIVEQYQARESAIRCILGVSEIGNLQHETCVNPIRAVLDGGSDA